MNNCGKAALLGVIAGAMKNCSGSERQSPVSDALKSARPAPGPMESDAGMSMFKTGLVYDDFLLKHDPGEGHPETPERLEAIIRRLNDDGLMAGISLIKPLPAEPEWVEQVHASRYVAEVAGAVAGGAPYIHSPDTGVSEDSYSVALLAAGGVLQAIDSVMRGEVSNAFCAVRPPGHHALRARAMGFCLFNNAAIGARYLLVRHRCKRVFIVDWDVHHGNGTQEAFYADSNVFFFSAHRYPFYPGTGSREERGTGEGLGFTLNAPLPGGTDDDAYIKVFDEILRPEIIRFEPDFILVSAGFDSHKNDPLGGMRVTADGFAGMTALVKGLADDLCNGRMVSVLEGGYHLEGLSESAAAHIAVLSG